MTIRALFFQRVPSENSIADLVYDRSKPHRHTRASSALSEVGVGCSEIVSRHLWETQQLFHEVLVEEKPHP